MENKNTIMFGTANSERDKTTFEILSIVYDALEERGYNPVDQIVGFILSGDPSYITSHHDARNLIRQLGRDELTEELVRAFLNKK